MRHFSFPLLLLAILITSCHKEDRVYPEVEIISPGEGSTYSYGDTIRVIARVSQKKGGENVDVLDGNAVLPFGVEKISESGGKLVYDLFYNYRYLDGGKYDIRFTVFHGDNRRSDFLGINLRPLPRHLAGLAAVCNGGNSRNIFVIDSLGQSHQQNLPGDFRFLAANPVQQSLAVAPVLNGKLTGFGLYDFHQSYQLEKPLPQGSVQYHSLISAGDYIYAFENSGRVIGLSEDGSIFKNFELPAGKKLISVAANGEFFLTGVSDQAGGDLELLLLRRENGAVIKSEKVNAVPLFIEALEGGNFAVVLQNASDAEIGEFDKNLGLYTRALSLSQQQVSTVTSIGKSRLIFSTTQNIYEFDLKTSTIPAQLYTFAADALCYDPVSKQVYLAQGSVVSKALPGSSLASVATCPGPVIDFKLMYNK